MIQAARRNRRPLIWIMGGHRIKLGLSRFLIDLLERRAVGAEEQRPWGSNRRRVK
jgi:hypothetical protein